VCVLTSGEVGGYNAHCSPLITVAARENWRKFVKMFWN